jgi:hypothetical protein
MSKKREWKKSIYNSASRENDGAGLVSHLVTQAIVRFPRPRFAVSAGFHAHDTSRLCWHVLTLVASRWLLAALIFLLALEKTCLHSLVNLWIVGKNETGKCSNLLFINVALTFIFSPTQTHFQHSEYPPRSKRSDPCKPMFKNSATLN